MIPARMVLLEHTLADGSRHFDWLMQRPREDDAPSKRLDLEARELLSFRVAERIDRAPARRFVSQRMEDHRNLYLTYSGEVSGGRGSVRPVARGVVMDIEEMEGAIAIRGFFVKGSAYLWAGSKEDAAGASAGWTFQRSAKLRLPRVDADRAEAGFASWYLGDATANGIGLASDWLSDL